MTSPPTSVEVRRYADIEAFQTDANVMALDGWIVVAQSETSGSIEPVWVGLAIIGAFVGLFFYWPAILLLILAVILGVSSRRKQLVVTYRLEPKAGRA